MLEAKDMFEKFIEKYKEVQKRERTAAGEYERAYEEFSEAFKDWEYGVKSEEKMDAYESATRKLKDKRIDMEKIRMEYDLIAHITLKYYMNIEEE